MISMKYMKLIIVFFVVFLSTTACKYDIEEELYPIEEKCDTSNVTYSGTIAPIIENNCNICHSQGIQTASIVTEGYDNLIIHINNGFLWGTVNHEAGFSPMPKNGNKLPECSLKQIKTWIDQGALNN